MRPTHAHLRRRWSARPVAAALAAALLLGACSGGDEPGPSGADTATTQAGDREVGPEIEAGAATFRAPAGFTSTPTEDSPAVLATGPSGSSLSLVAVELAGEAPELERQQDIALDGLGEELAAEAPVEVDGVEMWHVTGEQPDRVSTDVYGAVVDGTAVRLTIRLADAAYDEDERAAVNEQVLSSWSWA